MSQKQPKLPGFTDEQLDEIEAAIEAYQGAKDRLDAATLQLKNDVSNATEALVEVMRKYKRTQIVLEGRLVQIFDLVKIKVTGRKLHKEEGAG